MIAQSLRAADRQHCQNSSRELVRQPLSTLEVAPVRTRVLAARPSESWGELHGLYERDDGGRAWPVITVWMRTARRRQVIAFRTFLRTLLHEVLHHLDYELFELEDSYPLP